MTPESLTDLADALRRYRLLGPAQLAEVDRDLRARFPEPRALARELVQRGWLTPYQVNQLFQGRPAGLLLGSYVLLEKLGEGGMGAVYKARNWKLEKVVALKLMRRDRLSSADAVRRFRREIRAAAQLEHPNIVRALDADEVGGGHFLVMEYVAGTDLARLVKQQGPLPVAQACEYVRQAALGLQHAHEKGLVHRDVKPQNLLLTPEGQVKVLDMGLARLGEAAEGEPATTVTREGAVMGTPDYMAPEQSLDAHLVDIRADLYSLGCTLYYLLTGKVPFPGGSMAEKLMRHQLREPVPVEHLRPDVPPGVAAVVRRLMAKRPEDRYPTPADLARALAGAVSEAPGDGATLAGLSASAATAAGEPAGRPAPGEVSFSLPHVPPAALVTPGRDDRRRWLVAGGVAGALLLLGLVLMLWRPWWPAEGPRPGPPAAPNLNASSLVVADPPPVDAAWLKRVAGLPADRQVEEVAAKLKERNRDFDGRVGHKVEGGVVTRVHFLTDAVADISPLRALTGLKALDCGGSDKGKGILADLSPLQGMPLTSLRCACNPVADLAPLQGMRLTWLDCWTTAVRDLAPLRGMPLTELYLGATEVGDLSPLRGMPLARLQCGWSKVKDLSPLRGMGLKYLDCRFSEVDDLWPLLGTPLQELLCDKTLVTDLSPLKGMPLTRLLCDDSPVRSLEPLRELPLKRLVCDFSPWRGDAEVLRAIPTLHTINRQPAGEFWKNAEVERVAFERWAAATRKLPAADQVKAVAEELKRRNPKFDGAVRPSFNGAAVFGLEFATDHVTDVSPVLALPGLTGLWCQGKKENRLLDLWPLRGLGLKTLSVAGARRLSDLSPLKGMPLEVLYCHHTRVSDLGPLRGMPLRELHCSDTRVSDLLPLAGMPLAVVSFANTPVSDVWPLKGMPLKSVECPNTPVSDLRPLAGMALGSLVCWNTAVADLGPLRGMPLEFLNCHDVKVRDLSPLKGMPLHYLEADLNPWRDREVLRSLPKLATLNGKPVAEFFRPLDEFDAWCKRVAALPPQAQVDAVVEELKKRNPGFDGKVKAHTGAGGVVRELDLPSAAVSDLAPVRALPGLRFLRARPPEPAGRGALRDLWPLKGMRLRGLDCWQTEVDDLAPLAGMPLEVVLVGHTRVSDLAPLRGMKLRSLHCPGTAVRDVSVVRGMPLEEVNLPATLGDFSPLRGMHLVHYWGPVSPWRDAEVLRPMASLKTIGAQPAAAFWKQFDADRAAFDAWVASVRKLPAEEQVKAVAAELKKRNPAFDGKVEGKVGGGVVTGLRIVTAGVTDLSPVRALPGLTDLSCHGQAAHDLEDLGPLKGVPLTELAFGAGKVADLSALRGMPLRRLLCGSTAVADLAPLRGMPLETLDIGGTRVSDLTPLRTSAVKWLNINGLDVADLRPLQGLPLTDLDLASTRVRDLSPLRGMPLEHLRLGRTPVSDLSPVKGMRLKTLWCTACPISDLSPLKGMPLTWLLLDEAPVTDVSPLRGMPLEQFGCAGTRVADLGPLRGMPLRELRCDFRPARDEALLRSLKNLEVINGQPAARFWEQVGAAAKP